METRIRTRHPYGLLRSVVVVSLLTAACLSSIVQAVSEEKCEGGGIGFLPPEPAAVPEDFTGHYVPGGRNVNASRYVVSPGYPPIPDRAKFVGMLSGTWFQMGRSLGERAGDKIRCTSDIWWQQICKKKGKTNTLKAMKLYEQQISAMDRNQIEFLKGITAGAAPWLNQSHYAKPGHQLHEENYWRVIAASIWDCWLWGSPEGLQTGCNSFAALGAATTDGRTVATQSTHTPHDGSCYLQSYIIAPPKGNAVWTVAATPSVIGLMVVNDKGVSISHHFGGATNTRSLEYPGGPYRANAFGVPWWNLVLYAAINADTAKEAIDLLTVGSKKYRTMTGRKTILRDGAWNWMVADSKTLAVVEASANRHAVRFAGKSTGPKWTDKNFIVCANHFLCDFSYDEHNQRTNVPMTIFNVNQSSEARFWTLMWEIKERYGRVDKYVAQHILGTTYGRNKETGEIIECAQTENSEWDLFAHANWSVQGAMTQGGLAGGTNTAKVAVLDGSKSMVSWTLGNPSDWEGAWDEYYFNRESWTEWQWWNRQ
jgi:hypothetical protein